MLNYFRCKDCHRAFGVNLQENVEIPIKRCICCGSKKIEFIGTERDLDTKLEELSRRVNEHRDFEFEVLNRILGLIERLVERDKVDVGAIELSLMAALIKPKKTRLEELAELKEWLEKLGLSLK